MKISELFLHVILPVILGASIYLLFRTTDLLMFHWLRSLGFWSQVLSIREIVSQIHLSNWILYSLPDGIWVYSSTYLMMMIWRKDLSFTSRIWISAPVTCAIVTEILQVTRTISGSFDFLDLEFNVLAFQLSLIIGDSKC